MHAMTMWALWCGVMAQCWADATGLTLLYGRDVVRTQQKRNVL